MRSLAKRQPWRRAWPGGLALGLLLVCGLPRQARAQSAPDASEPAAPPAANEPALTPPQLLRAVELQLPEGVRPTEAIEVLLSIDAEGHVTAAQLVQSHGATIDSVVLEAARRVRFLPARRGDAAIASRVRFRFELAEPPVTPGSEPPIESAHEASPETDAQPELTPGPITLDDDGAGDGFGAVARVDRPQPGAASRVALRGRALTLIPGTFGEPLRVVATLPGVARSPFGLGFFLVRGASFQNTGFFVDGFQVPLLYHLGAGPAILSSRLVDQLDFYPGGFPVAFGRFTAGVISLRTAPPPTDRVQVEVELDLLRASGLAIVPISDRGSIAVALRRSYYELLLPLVTDDVSLSYTDYQLRLDYQLAERLRLSLFYFGSRDSFEAAASTGAGATTGTASTGLEYAFDQVILTLEHRTTRELRVRWSGTLGPSSIELGSDSTGDASLGFDTTALRLGQRAEIVITPSEVLQTTLGVEESVFIYDVAGNAPSFGELPGIPSPSFSGEALPFEDRLLELTLAPYFEQVVRPGPFEITAGLRVEHMRYGDVAPWPFDPRGVVRLRLGEIVTLKAATGLFSQPPLPFYLTRDTLPFLPTIGVRGVVR